jgi:hypothetical protein
VPSSLWTTAAVFALLIVCVGLWYGSRAVGKERRAPSWANQLDRHPRALVAVVGLAVLALVALAVVALGSLALAALS